MTRVTEPIVWIIAGLVMLGAELLFSGFIIVFFGIAAVATGILIWGGMPTTNGIEYAMFSGISIGLLVFLRRRFQAWFRGSSISGDSDDDIIGREGRVESGFDSSAPDRGKISFRGAGWDARSRVGPLQPGSYVRIVARHGLTLEVEPVNALTKPMP
jgi:inner membrane protein